MYESFSHAGSYCTKIRWTLSQTRDLLEGCSFRQPKGMAIEIQAFMDHHRVLLYQCVRIFNRLKVEK